ncbi:MAG: hypothetical protein HOM87_08800 [Proteobacteria bacterium]|nr:hypothetical protein [Pseudomonadota bacterium]MBT7812385.1 hypothetical protein [Pseudomonadota bacterium]
MPDSDTEKDSTDSIQSVDSSQDSTVEKAALPNVARNSGRGIAVLGLVVAVMGVVLSAYTFYVTQVGGRFELGLELGRVDGISRQLDKVVLKNESLESSLDEARSKSLEIQDRTRSQISAVESELGLRIKTFSDQQSQESQQQRKELDAVAGALAEMSSRIVTAEQEWQLNEIGYLLELAHQRLTLTGDINLAQKALLIADDRLSGFVSPEILEIRRSISDDLKKINKLLVSDFSATAIDLSTLIHKIAGLPLKGDNARPSWENVQLEESSEPDTIAAEKSDQNNLLTWVEEIFGDVSRLIQIRRVDQTQLPKLESSQRFLAYENLRLQLLAGQLALLRRDQEVFEASIQQSRAWLIAYFEEPDAAVMSFDRRLVEISEIKFAWEVPSISKTLDLMREEIKRREQRL